MWPKSVTNPSVTPRAMSRLRISSNASSDSLQREVIEATSLEHGHLTLVLGVAGQLEHVQLGTWPDAHDRQLEPIALLDELVGCIEHTP